MALKPTTLFLLAVVAVAILATVFHVRVALAGGKYLLAIAALLFVLWLLTRRRL
jgi:hypothetical protein